MSSKYKKLEDWQHRTTLTKEEYQAKYEECKRRIKEKNIPIDSLERLTDLAYNIKSRWGRAVEEPLEGDGVLNFTDSE